VAVGERGVDRALRGAAGGNVRVDRPEVRLEGIGEALDVPAGQAGGGRAGGVHEGRVADQQLVGTLATAEPQLVGSLRVPPGGRRRPVDLPLHGVLPAGAHLGDRHAAASAALEADEDRGRVVGDHLAGDRVRRPLRGEGLDGAGRLVANLHERREIGHHALDPEAADEARQVQPVGPDVADGAERAALGRVQAPVPVGVQQEPVLEVVPGDHPDLAQLALAEQLGRVLVEGVEADVEVDGVDHPRVRGQALQLGGLGRRGRQRLLADDVPAGDQDPRDLREVERVRRRDVDHLDALVGQHLVHGPVGVRQAQVGGSLRPVLRRLFQEPVDRDAEPAQCLDVHGSDEPAADDGGADVADASHAVADLGILVGFRHNRLDG
jgi:hypothetical protein